MVRFIAQDRFHDKEEKIFGVDPKVISNLKKEIDTLAADTVLGLPLKYYSMEHLRFSINICTIRPELIDAFIFFTKFDHISVVFIDHCKRVSDIFVIFNKIVTLVNSLNTAIRDVSKEGLSEKEIKSIETIDNLVKNISGNLRSINAYIETFPENRLTRKNVVFVSSVFVPITEDMNKALSEIKKYVVYVLREKVKDESIPGDLKDIATNFINRDPENLDKSTGLCRAIELIGTMSKILVDFGEERW